MEVAKGPDMVDMQKTVPHNSTELTNEIAQARLKRFKERQAATVNATPTESTVATE